jgi:branched-subunit amino acid aminotransferase/4-amino-4-deoxychorismate lyase
MIVLEEDIDLSKVSSAQSIFLTSSIKLLQNVNSIEGNFWKFNKKYQNDVDLLYKKFKKFCTERSLEGMIGYGKEKKSGRMSPM